jgi:hypothetical protein
VEDAAKLRNVLDTLLNARDTAVSVEDAVKARDLLNTAIRYWEARWEWLGSLDL